jgi:hypothetical protein
LFCDESLDNIVFISKDGSEIRIPHDKTILIMDYFVLDGKGHRKRTKPNIKYQNFNYVPETEEEKKFVAKIDEIGLVPAKLSPGAK